MMTTAPHPKPRPCTRVYLLLVALTLVTWAIGRLGPGDLRLSLAILALALFKGQLIGDWFMGLRGLRGPWRWAIALWLLVPGGLITAAFVLAP